MFDNYIVCPQGCYYDFNHNEASAGNMISFDEDWTQRYTLGMQLS